MHLVESHLPQISHLYLNMFDFNYGFPLLVKEGTSH